MSKGSNSGAFVIIAIMLLLGFIFVGMYLMSAFVKLVERLGG